MYNQFHTAQYQGYQQGHDNALRSDSQQPSSYAVSSAASQYRGGFQNQQRYQPSGYVQSYYGQQQQPFQQRAGQFQNQQMGYGAASYGQMGQQSHHLANYRGNQLNHDRYLRSDSQQPSQIGFAAQQPQQMGMATQHQSSFHTANYQGNQPNHDQHWRSDSQQPSTYGMSSSYGIGQPQQQMNAGYQSTQQFHAANYQGNQPNHDNSLRSDSQQPSQMSGIGQNLRGFSSQSFMR